MRGEGCEEGEMQESGRISDVGVGDSSGEDGNMCVPNVPRNEYVDGGGIKYFCGGNGENGAGGEGDVEPQMYLDNHLPAEVFVYSTSSSLLVTENKAIEHTHNGTFSKQTPCKTSHSATSRTSGAIDSSALNMSGTAATCLQHHTIGENCHITAEGSSSGVASV